MWYPHSKSVVSFDDVGAHPINGRMSDVLMLDDLSHIGNSLVIGRVITMQALACLEEDAEQPQNGSGILAFRQSFHGRLNQVERLLQVVKAD